MAAKVDDAILNEIVEVFQSVTLKLNNQAQLTTAADAIARLGYEFAAANDGSTMESLDAFIPGRDRWK